MSTSEHAQISSLQNTNRYPTRQLVVMALMCALSILLSFIEFPLFPAAAFLKLDIALVPSTVVGLAYGAGPGIVVGFASAIAHAAITGNWVGALMNCIAACAYILPAALIYRKITNMKGLVGGLVASVACLTVAAIVANLVIDPLFYGMPFEAVAMLVVPAILPFNIIKGVVVGIVTGVAYKAIGGLITTSAAQR